ncbi:MAG: hypothetical protein ABIP75_03165 [Pyrinomonadaceae bacterium]
MDQQAILKVIRTQRADDRAREAQAQLEASGGSVEILGNGQGCNSIRITMPSGEVTTGIVCFGRGSSRRCEVCRKNTSVAQCDYPTGDACKSCKGKGKRGGGKCHPCAGSGFGMCNKHLCSECRGHIEPDEDYCPDHRVPAGLPPLLKRESCRWTTEPTLLRRDCLRQQCTTLIEYGQRVLFFAKRHRAMCSDCGEEYLDMTALPSNTNVVDMRSRRLIG